MNIRRTDSECTLSGLSVPARGARRPLFSISRIWRRVASSALSTEADRGPAPASLGVQVEGGGVLRLLPAGWPVPSFGRGSMGFRSVFGAPLQRALQVHLQWRPSRGRRHGIAVAALAASKQWPPWQAARSAPNNGTPCSGRYAGARVGSEAKAILEHAKKYQHHRRQHPRASASPVGIVFRKAV